MSISGKILVATDTSLSDQSIVETAVEIARICGASLAIVDVVNPSSWTGDLIVQSLEDVRESYRRTTGKRLRTIEQLVAGEGIEVEAKLLEGRTSTCLIREVISGGYDLLIAVSKGARSSSKGDLGETAELLQRNCPCELWLSPADVRPNLQSFLAQRNENGAGLAGNFLKVPQVECH